MLKTICYKIYQLFSCRRKQIQNPKPIDKLKNALLTHALTVICATKFVKNNNINYEDYDGTILPTLSGSNFNVACLSYITDPNDNSTNKMYSRQMENKKNAINKFLDQNLDSDIKIIKFFNEYLENY
jgi:hypothetical protein